MGWNHPNPIYMYPRRKKRPQCNKCKYKLGNLCYQRKYQDYDYAELEGTTKRNCKYFEEKQKNPSLRRKEIEQIRPSFKELVKSKHKKSKSPKNTNDKKVSWIFFLFVVLIISLFMKLWVLTILTFIIIAILFFSIDTKKKKRK